MKPVKVGDTIWIPPRPVKPVLGFPVPPSGPGYPRTILTQAEADAVNTAIAEGRPPFLPDIARRG